MSVTPLRRRKGTNLVGSSAGFAFVPTQTFEIRTRPAREYPKHDFNIRLTCLDEERPFAHAPMTTRESDKLTPRIPFPDRGRAARAFSSPLTARSSCKLT